MSKKTDLLVQRIHGEFDRAADAVVEQARVLVDDTLARKEMLRKLGMHEQPEMKQSSLGQAFKTELDMLNRLFPDHKVMERESLKPILKKYNLVYAPLSWFKGEIPTQNLRETAEFVEKMRTYGWSTDLPRAIREEMDADKSMRIVAPKKDIEVPKGENIVISSGFMSIVPKPVPKDPVVLFTLNTLCVIVTKWGVEADFAEFR